MLAVDAEHIVSLLVVCRALRRKIGGTARDYWKDWIEADVFENTYTKAGGPEVPYLPFLVGVVVAMLAATVYVVSQTA
jgi:hypothetical protein